MENNVVHIRNPKLSRRILVFHSSFYIIGLVLAYWLGLGWYMLIMTLRSVILFIPQIYLPTIRLVVGSEFVEQERIRLIESESLTLPSKAFFSSFTIRLLITIIMFWKANIPLRMLISLVITHLFPN
jgi:hypothetical protein